MPSESIPHGQQRPIVAKRHASSADNSDQSYDRAIIHATAAPFIMFPSAALLDSSISHRDKCVLMAMCWHANQRHLLWCRQQTLADELKLPISKISESIAQLIAHGYVEIVRKAYRGAENAALRTNKYRIIWQADKGDPDPDGASDDHISQQGKYESHISRYGKSIFPATGSHISRSGKQNNTNEQYQEEHPHPTDSFSITSPAPLARTRGRFDQASLRRDPLFIAITAYLPEPVLDAEWRQWAAMVNQLRRGGVTAADIPTAVKGWQLRWDISKLTLPALVHHWAEIREGKSSEQVATAIRNRKSSQAERAARERRREQRGEFQREYNAALGLPPDTPLPPELNDDACAEDAHHRR